MSRRAKVSATLVGATSVGATSADTTSDSISGSVSPVDHLASHILELRDKLIPAILAVVMVFVVLYGYSNEIYLFVAEPLRELLPSNTSMIATDVASPFLTPFKLTLLASFFVAMPFILFQLWRFVAPALYRSERYLAIPVLCSSLVLFYSGIAFVYFVVFPLVFSFFTSASPEGVAVMTDIGSYLDFVIKMFFAFGIVFQIPILIVVLVSTGASSVESLKAKRPYIVIACFTLGMLLTPPDVISQTLLALPMWLLFELGLICSSFLSSSD